LVVLIIASIFGWAVVQNFYQLLKKRIGRLFGRGPKEGDDETETFRDDEEPNNIRQPTKSCTVDLHPLSVGDNPADPFDPPRRVGSPQQDLDEVSSISETARGKEREFSVMVNMFSM